MKISKPKSPQWSSSLTEPIRPESLDNKAIRMLNEQLQELEGLRRLNGEDPNFTAWHDTTVSLLRRILRPNSPYLARFIDIGFSSQAYPAPPGYDRRCFVSGCGPAEATLRAVVREIEHFGVHVGQPAITPAVDRGGVHQTFHGPVTIQRQAIATDNAIQKIGHMGDTIGASLREIAEVFRQSEELTPRQAKEGLAGIEALAIEVQKPEAKRNWKSVLDCGQTILTIADKATDLTHKLAPYLPVVVTLVQSAKHAF